MFEIVTNFRTFFVEASGQLTAFRMALSVKVEGEVIREINFAGKDFPFLIVEVVA